MYTANAKLEDLFDAGPLKRSCRRVTRRALALLESEAAKRTPVAKPPPGVAVAEFTAMRARKPRTLKESWRHTDVDETVGPGGTPRFEGEAYTEDPVGPLVEWNTRPHLIRPRADRAAASVVETQRPRRGGTDPKARLRFIDRHGRVVYRAEVHHPGTTGKHMMRDALNEVEATWSSRIGDEEVERWAREQARLVG